MGTSASGTTDSRRGRRQIPGYCVLGTLGHPFMVDWRRPRYKGRAEMYGPFSEIVSPCLLAALDLRKAPQTNLPYMVVAG